MVCSGLKAMSNECRFELLRVLRVLHLITSTLPDHLLISTLLTILNLLSVMLSDLGPAAGFSG